MSNFRSIFRFAQKCLNIESAKKEIQQVLWREKTQLQCSLMKLKSICKNSGTSCAKQKLDLKFDSYALSSNSPFNIAHQYPVSTDHNILDHKIPYNN